MTSQIPPAPGSVSAIRKILNLPWLTILLFTSILLGSWIYWSRTRLPHRVSIAGGPQNGRYAQLAEGIAEELRRRHSLDVDVLTTKGSLENLQLLETHKADFGLYQPGTRLTLEGQEASAVAAEPAKFISNLYPEYLIPVSPESNNPHELDGTTNRIWCCGDRLSGDYAVTKLLLQHLNLVEQDVDIRSLRYVDLPQEIQSGQINIGIICCGLQAPILKEVFRGKTGRPVSVPAADAMALKYPSLTRATIPAGYFQTSPGIPAADFPTVSLQAQLLADSMTSVRLAEEVTRIITDARFQRRFGLTELFSGGIEYATSRPEYEMHPGASHVFYPGLKPLINPDFVEGTEGLRSFIVSLIAAAWLLHRWWTKRKTLSQEHRLDRYVKELLELERAQMDVDGDKGDADTKALQQMLDRVTLLRQDALSEFTAHELNEDRAVDCFIEMCHALSDKINAKLTRSVILTAAGIQPNE